MYFTATKNEKYWCLMWTFTSYKTICTRHIITQQSTLEVLEEMCNYKGISGVIGIGYVTYTTIYTIFHTWHYLCWHVIYVYGIRQGVPLEHKTTPNNVQSSAREVSMSMYNEVVPTLYYWRNSKNNNQLLNVLCLVLVQLLPWYDVSSNNRLASNQVFYNTDHNYCVGKRYQRMMILHEYPRISAV